MVLGDANLLDIPVWVAIAHFLEDFSQAFVNAFDQDFSSVSGDPDDVVLGFVDRMGLLVQFHASIIHEDAGPCSHPRPARRGALAGLEFGDAVFKRIFADEKRLEW